MTQWQSVPLGEAIELAYGKSLPKGSRVESGSIPVYGSNGITGWHDTAVVDGPTVIVGRKGSAGAVQFVDGPCFPIDTTYFARPRQGFDFDIKFLFYMLRQLDLSRLKTATGVPGLTREDAYRETIRVPPLPEQRRIVDLLSRAEGIVRLRREAEKKAAELIPALFLDMFGDPAANPKGWPTKSIKNLVTFVSGGTPSKSRDDFWVGDLPWVSPKDMKRMGIEGAIDHVNRKVLTETSIKQIPVGSVLIVVRGMILVHTVPVAMSMVPLTINQDMKALVPNEAVVGDYLLWLLKVLEPRLLGMVATAAHGTKKLETDDLERFVVPIPPVETQKEFVSRVRGIESIQLQQANATIKAVATFDSLLAAAFNESAKAVA